MTRKKALLVGRQTDSGFIKYLEVLNERYKECDSKGHQKPDKRSGMCGYCYRHLDYDTPEADKILKGRKGILPIFEPLDAGYINQKRGQEIGSQKELEWAAGIMKLRKELEAESNV